MVQEKVAAPLWLPAASWALTENVWLPWLRPEYVFGLEQTLNAPLSSWQTKLTPFCASLNLKAALVWVVGLAGVDVMIGTGGAVVSTVQVKVAIPLRLPAASCALTEKVCLPSFRSPA